MTKWTVGACAHNGSFDDRESMWADNEPTSGTYGRMFVSYNDYTTSCGAGGCLFVTYSDDGMSWSNPKQLNTGTFFRNVQVTGSPRGAKLIGKNSTVFIASMDEGAGGNATRHNLMFSRLCTLQREFCSRCNVELLHPLEFNGISRAKPLAS